MNIKRWSAAAVAAGAAAAAYARWIEPRWIELRRPVIRIPSLADGLEGLRVGLLTDLHAGHATPVARVRRAVRLVMAEQPHLIALTGDFAADDSAGFADVFQALSSLRAPYGVYAVPGNHDYAVGIDKWRRQLRLHPGITDLTNRAVLRDVGGSRLCVAGIDDYFEGRPRLMLPPPSERDLTLLLAHSPDEAERSGHAADAIDLVLSGHTHGGQVQLPGGVTPVSSAEHPEYVEGLRRRPWTRVYTSRGLGTIGMPIRFLARPEVTVLRLTSTAAGDREPDHAGAILGRDGLSEATDLLPGH